MATYFAEIGADGKVRRVIVADQSFIDSGVVGDPKNWVETFMDGGIRKNYAGIGHEYHKDIDAFVAPKLEKSYVLDPITAEYKPPVEMPKDGQKYAWNEAAKDFEVRTDVAALEATAVEMEATDIQPQ